MPEGMRDMDLAARLASAGEAFVVAWSSVPPDLSGKVSASQLRALIAIRRGKAATVTDLARSLGALPSSATRLCDRLTAAGYIERAANPANRRFHVLSLTREGAEILRVLDTHREVAIAAVLGRMTQRARQQLAEGMLAFAKQAEQAAPANRPVGGAASRAPGRLAGDHSPGESRPPRLTS